MERDMLRTSWVAGNSFRTQGHLAFEVGKFHPWHSDFHTLRFFKMLRDRGRINFPPQRKRESQEGVIDVHVFLSPQIIP